MASTLYLPDPPALWSFQSVRLDMMMLLFGASVTIGWIRGSIGVVILCVVKRFNNQVGSYENDTKAFTEVIRQQHFHSKDPHAWLSPTMQSLLHSSYYFGGLLGLITAAPLIRKFRSKRVLTFGLLLNSFGSVLTTLVAATLPYLTILLLRALMGFGSGFLMPCSISLINKWFPASEKNTAVLTIFIGSLLGISGSMLVTPLMDNLTVVHLPGWMLALTSYGIMGTVLTIVWEKRAAYKPRHSSYVTATELDYIRGKRLNRRIFSRNDLRTPLKKILLLPSVIAILLNGFTLSFVNSAATAYLPIFTRRYARMDSVWNGITSSLPFLIQALAIVAAYSAVNIVQLCEISTTAVVKGCSVLGTSIASSCIIALLGIQPSRIFLTTALLCIGMGFLSATIVGSVISIRAVAPQYSHLVLTYFDGFAQFAGVLAPIVTQMLSISEKSMPSRALLCILAVLLVTGLYFAIFGQGRREIINELFARRLLEDSTSRGEHRVQSSSGAPTSIAPPEIREVDAVFIEGEASIPLRYDDLSVDFLEDLTSDEEY
ncbi:unnamed protein product [Cylicocyclus nassatus]|uniref:Major facilitator superfamily (MFS) profile domain-containing protein n=1 Tax=Cylicocyclus nassatus TaxID=53992 RepID=A0AA36DU16_CYLNA|nr:unnamed protein product [Cylicocyclus nassatus]